MARKSNSRLLLIVTLCVTMATPPEAWATTTANPGPFEQPPDCPPMGSGGDCGTAPPGPSQADCSSCEEECPPPAPPMPVDCPPEAPACTEDPIYLRYGTAFETAVDLRLVGPTSVWQHSRSYNSGSDQLAMTTNQGNGWFSQNSEVLMRSMSIGHTRVSMRRGATSNQVFELQGSDWAPETPTTLGLTHDTANDQYVVTDERSGEVWIFHDFTASSDQGRLKEQTTRYWRSAGKTGILFTYSAGRINQITTAEGQEYSITFTYTSSDDRISVIEVNEGAQILMKAEYTYFELGVHSADLGSAGDLVQVKISKRATNGTDWIDRYTQYRYDSGSRLKGIYPHEAIFSLIANNSTIDTPPDVLTREDAYSTGSTGSLQVQAFASRLYTYYGSDQSTASVTTAFATGENLQSAYGGANTNETGMVKQGIDRPEGCASCGGSGGGGAVGVSYEYYYMTINHGASPGWNDVVWLAVEDVKDSTGSPVKRTVWGFNNGGQVLREAVVLDPVAAPKYWCTSRLFHGSHDGQLAERREVSAHTEVNSASLLRQFLDPSTGSNDSATLNNSSGVVDVYEYDGDGRRVGTLVKEGESGTAYYVAYTQYETAAAQGHPKKMWRYATQEDTDPTTTGFYTEFDYTFWDIENTRIKTRQVISPVVATTQNGSGVASSTWEYYDEQGRLRWTKDGEGYVTYRAYHPSTGGLAYLMVDVHTASLSGEITAGSAGKWIAWSGGVPTELARNGSLPSALQLVVKREYDSLGRPVRSIEPGGSEHYAVYEQDRTIQFPNWDSGNGQSRTPIQVILLNPQGNLSEQFAVGANYTSIAVSSGAPTGFSAEPSQSAYVSWTRLGYDPLTGEMNQADAYYDIPTSGAGSLGTNYNRTLVLHDPMGRRGATVQYVAASKYQVSAMLYDRLGRVTETRRGVATSPPTDYDDLDNAIGSPPGGFSGYATIGQTVYDNGGVGDGRVTSSKRYFGTGSTDFIDSIPKYTFRGHVRGVEQKNNTTAFGPYRAQDIDWMGRTVASATYTSAPTWPTDYGTFVASISSNRNDMTKMYYDDLGRVYRTERYPGTQGTNHLRTDNYYDRNGRLVASGDPHGVTTEMAYDGAGRQYQQRVVKELSSSTPYSSGAFVYCDPAPLPGLVAGWSAAGNDGVIEMSHTVYDASGNAVEEHQFEKNHTDTDGLTFSGTADYVRSTTHHWYDGADRLTASAYYGSGNTSSADAWQFTTAPTRGSALTFTDAVVYDGKALLTTYGYNAASGRAESTTMGVKKNGMNTDTTTTKTFYDDLGRRVFVAENWVDFAAPSTGIGGGTNNDQDRVTGWEYFGLGQVHKLTAYNNSGSTANQVTEYRYADPHDASRVTMTIYPDGDATSDNVQVAYHLDGLVNTRTDQRGVVMTYTYDAQRRVIREGATTLPSGVDGSVKAIGRSYDPLGQAETITSYPNADGSGTPVNQIKYSYDSTHGRLTKTEQSHAGAVTTGTPAVQYAYDSTAVSGLYTNALRRIVTVYPNYRVVWEEYGATGGLDNRLGRVAELRDGGPGGTLLAEYEYNGVGRPVTRRLAQPKVVQQDDWNEDREYETLDRFGRRLRMWHHGDGYAGNYNRYDDFLYEYDYAGNRTKRDLFIDTGMMTSNLTGVAYTSDDFDQEYVYDGLQRLAGSEQKTDAGANNREELWGLDQLGNWSGFKIDANGDGVFTSAGDLDQTRVHNQANEVGAMSEASGQAAWQTVTHDAAGNMTVFPSPVRPEDGASCVYDAWNRLIIYDDVTWAVVTKYDGLHRRVSRQVVNTVHYYLNEQWQEIEERATESGPATKQFVWGATYIDELVCRDRDADANGTSLEERLYALYDALYSVTCVVNAAGVVQERYAYSPYGESTVLNADFSVKSGGSSIDWQHRFTGRRRDPETGLQLNRYRYYHAGLGRWVTRDPIGYDSDTYDLYVYANGSPGVFKDPLGLLFKECVETAMVVDAGILEPTDAAAAYKIPGYACLWVASIGADIIIIRCCVSGSTPPSPPKSNVPKSVTRPTSVGRPGGNSSASPPCPPSQGPDRCAELKAIKEMACASADSLGGCGRLPECRGIGRLGCHLRELAFAGCADAREAYQRVCWKKGDPGWEGHQEAIALARSAARKCAACTLGLPE